MVGPARLLALVILGLAALAAGMAPQAAVADGLTLGEARLEVVLDEPEQRPLVKEMVLATIRGTYTVTIGLEELTVPRMSGLDWIQLARDAWTERTIDGRRVLVMERRVAFFPQRAGELTIDPVAHALTVLGRNGSRTEHVVRSEPVRLHVEPAPAEAGWWLPARAVEMADTWDRPPGALDDDGSVTRRVSVWALGATREMLPPQPPMREPWLVTFIAPERRTTELTPAGPISTVTWVWHFNPTTGEPGIIPEVQIPWFDTEARQARTLTLPPVPIAQAGFGDNVAAWQFGFARWFAPLLGVLAGAAAVLVLAAPGGRLRPIRAMVRRRLSTRLVWRLRRAGRRGDAAATRRAAAALLRQAEVGEAAALQQLEPLDRTLYGAAEDAGAAHGPGGPGEPSGSAESRGAGAAHGPAAIRAPATPAVDLRALASAVERLCRRSGRPAG